MVLVERPAVDLGNVDKGIDCRIVEGLPYLGRGLRLPAVVEHVGNIY